VTFDNETNSAAAGIVNCGSAYVLYGPGWKGVNWIWWNGEKAVPLQARSAKNSSRPDEVEALGCGNKGERKALLTT
jgi:hypothetical protein